MVGQMGSQVIEPPKPSAGDTISSASLAIQRFTLGYSAVTASLIGMQSRTGLFTFHGPTLLNGFGGLPKMLTCSFHQFENVLLNTIAPGPCRPPEEWKTDFPRDDRSHARLNQNGWRWHRSGQAQGRLIGGNLATLRTLAGTPFRPSFKDTVLLLEEVKAGPSILQEVDQSLAHLAMQDVFADIRGLVVGKLNDATAFETRMFDRLISQHTAGYNFPNSQPSRLGAH